MSDKDNNNNGHSGDFNDYTVNDLKELVPGLGRGPLLSANLDSGNPGIRLISNDDRLIDMLKIVYVEDYDFGRSVAEALAECDEFLLNPDGKENPEVKQRVEWIKYLLAIFCSVRGRFADKYTQAATGVLTNAMDEKGWGRIQMPMGGKNSDGQYQSNKPENPNSRRP
jgi:hypothetical protein